MLLPWLYFPSTLLPRACLPLPAESYENGYKETENQDNESLNAAIPKQRCQTHS